MSTIFEALKVFLGHPAQVVCDWFFLCLIIEKCMLVGGYRKDLAWGSNCHYL